MRHLFRDKGLSERSLEALFNEFDMSKDGLIDINELGRFLNPIYGPDCTREDRELWAEISDKTYMNYKRFKDRLGGDANVDRVARSVNIEGNPNVTFWQFLRAKGTEERKQVDAMIRKSRTPQKEDNLMFLSMDNQNQFQSHQPSGKLSMVGPAGAQYQQKPRLGGRNLMKNKLCLKKDKPKTRRNMYAVGPARDHVKISRSPGIMIKDTGSRNPRTSPPKAQIYVNPVQNPRYRSRSPTSPYNQNIKNTRYRNTSK